MKTLGWVLGLVALLVLNGCVSSAARLDRVQDGMTKDQVLALLGAPDGARLRGEVEYLTYYLTADGKAGEQPYMVRLVSGRVDTVGRFAQLSDLEGAGRGRPQAGMGAILSAQAFPDVATQLRQLAALKDRGELSEADFNRARRELLAAEK